MFRERAVPRRSTDAYRPLRLVTVPAALALGLVLALLIGGALWLFVGTVGVRAYAPGVVVNPPGNTDVIAPATGVVVEGPTPPGGSIRAGDVVARIRTDAGAVKDVRAPVGGTVVSLGAQNSAWVRTGSILLTIAPSTGPMVAYLFVPFETVAQVYPGLDVEVAPAAVDPAVTGVLRGVITGVSALPVTRLRVETVVNDPQAVDEITRGGPVHEIAVRLQSDANGALTWTGSGPDPSFRLTSGSLAVGQVIVKEQTPWQALTGTGGADRPPAPAPDPEPTQAQQLPITAYADIRGSRILLEVARTPEEQATGLMFRSELADDRGMLFPVQPPTDLNFWMRNTLIPLDIIYLRAGVVTAIAAQVQPCLDSECPTFSSGGPVDQVIEVRSGLTAELGLKVGDRVTVRFL